MNKNGDLGTAVTDYVDENLSTKVVEIIQCYTGIVNRCCGGNSIFVGEEKIF